MYTEPDYARYTKLMEENPDKIKAMAKVLVDTVSVNYSGTVVDDIRMMAINTKDFGNTA